MSNELTFAVPKGRILDEALPVMARAGVVPEAAFPALYAPVDLDIGHCRLSVAEPKGSVLEPMGKVSHLRVATKYPNITKRWFESQGIQAECVKLNGAMELAPSLGLSERIVDLVSTGRTLVDNGLVECATILPVSARLIVNRAALKTDPRVAALVEAFRAVADEKAA